MKNLNQMIKIQIKKIIKMITKTLKDIDILRKMEIE